MRSEVESVLGGSIRRIVARRRTSGKSLAIVFLVSVMISAAVGLVVYNLDKSYVASKFDLVTYVPDRLLAGQDASILIITMDRAGNPLPNRHVEVSLKGDGLNQTLWTGTTDSKGFASPAFKAPSNSGKAELVVTSGTEEVVSKTVVDDTIRIIITTDKPIYQPGQTVHLRVLSFSGANPLPQEMPLVLEVIDPNGDKVFKKQLTPNEFGIASYDLALSDQLIQGAYTIKAQSGEREASKVVVVKDYVLPKFRVDLLGMRDWYLVNQAIWGTVDAEYFFGEPVSGTVRINASVYYGVWTQVASRSGTLSLGSYSFTLPSVGYAIGIPEAQGNGYLQINVSVTDSGGHTEARSKIISIAPQSLAVTVLADSCISGRQSTFHAIVRTPDGKPVNQSTVTMVLIDEKGAQNTLPAVITDARGVAQITFIYRGESKARIWANAGSTTGYMEINLGDGTGVKVVSDKSSFHLGDVGTFDVFYSGNSLTSNAYYDVVSRGFIVDRGVLDLVDGSASLKVQMTPEMEPFAQVRVYKIEADMDVVRDAVTFQVGTGPELSVSVATQNASYYPRDRVDLIINTSVAGQPVVAALGISIIDEAVYELGSQFQGYEELVFGLDQQFMEPQYQILSYVYAGASSLPAASDSIVSDVDTGRMNGTWEANRAEAAALRASAVDSYWNSMLLLGGLGLFAGTLWIVRLGKGAGIAVIMAILLIGVPLSGILVYMSFGTSYGSGGSKWNDGNATRVLLPRGGLPEFAWRQPEQNKETIAPTGNMDYGDGSSQGPSQSQRPQIVRNFFPETWYWNPFLITDDSGSAHIALDAPDSITSWKVDVVASTTNGHVGGGNGSVRVFQPFFIDPDIPVSVVRNDVFQLKVQVYNYLVTSQTVNVTLAEEPWFSLLSPSTQSVIVESNYVSFVTFTIQAKIVGWHTISLSGSAGTVTDAIVKEMRVVPDGKKIETLVNGDLENATATKTLSLDPSRIQDSENAWVKLQSGVEAVLLEGVDAFINYVTGCGEQSLSMLSIDILAYDTVRQQGTAPDKLFTYESMVNQGIQHELMYLVDANNGLGRGIVWFPGDQDVHPWLTSWGLIAFQDAINAGFGLDEKIIKDMQSWLESIQNADGSWKFPDWGIYEYNNPLLKSKQIAATAYIARALLYSGIPGSDEHITKAVDYVQKHVGEIMDDPFTLALSLLVLQKGGGTASTRSLMAEQLNSLKNEENGTYYWDSSTSLVSDEGNNAYNWGRCSARLIETTGYAAMALHGEQGYAAIVDGAVKYMLNNRQDLGGWFSTQDTIVAFQTLKAVSGVGRVKDVQVRVSVEALQIFDLRMNDSNKDITYYVDLRPYLKNITNVSIHCEGEGSILYSVYLAQFIPWAAAPPITPYLTLRVTYDATQIALTEHVDAHMYLLYNGSAPSLKMILVDLRAPMGLSFVLSEFDALKAAGRIASFDSNDRQVVVYLTDVISGTAIQFDYTLVPQMPIKSTVQDISAWDMYDPNIMRAETMPVQFEVT